MEGDLPSDSADVIVDVVGRPGPFTYAVDPEAEVGLGDEVVVPLGARRVSGWVVARPARAREHPSATSLRSVLRRVRPGPPPEVIEAVLAAAMWAVASPVTLLRAARRPRIRGAPVLEPARGQLAERLVDPSEVTPEVFLVPLAVSASEELGRLMAAGAFGERVVIAAPTGAIAAQTADALARVGVRAARFPDDWDQLACGRATVSIGGRRGALAPLATPDAVVVLDPIHPNARDEASPYLEALDLAGVRASVSQSRLVVVSAVPPADILARARVRVATRAPRSWPVVRTFGLADLDRGIEGLVADGLAVARRRRADPGALVVVPAQGPGHAPVCRACGATLTCAACDGRLVVLPARRGVPERGWCRTCEAVRPLRCGVCGSPAVRVSRWSVEHVAARLEPVVRQPIAKGPDSRAGVVVGTIEALEGAGSVDLVVLVEPERLFGSHGRLAEELGLYWIHRALALVAPNRGEVDLVVEHVPAWLPEVLAERDARRALRAIRDERAALGLDPDHGTAVVSGPEAAAFVHALSEMNVPGFEVAELAPDRWLLTAPTRRELRVVLGSVPRTLDARAVRVEIDPREL